MGKHIIVQTSELSGRIYAGTPKKNGKEWSADQTDVTGMACAAVAQHALMEGGHIVVTANGKLLYEISVKEAPDEQDQG